MIRGIFKMTISGAKAKWLLGGAIVSLCLNLFLVGGIIAGHVHGPMGGPEGKGGMIMATVPPELKPIIREKLKARGPEFKAEREKIKALRVRVADALAAEPFDVARLDVELAELEKTAGRHSGACGAARLRDKDGGAAGSQGEEGRRW
jgi:uncharacterized membrane protein